MDLDFAFISNGDSKYLMTKYCEEMILFFDFEKSETMRLRTLKKLGRLVFINLIFGVEIMAIEVDGKGKCLIEEMEYPAIGFGTYPLKNEICFKALTDAAELGYRIIDTATFYDNFEPIGKVLKKFGRDNFYVISKVWPDSQTPEELEKDLKMTLDRLQTTYLDAYLLHWPNSKISIDDILNKIEELRAKGLIRHIGLSNVNTNHLKRALEVKVPISWVQVEMHPLYYDSELLAFCKRHSIIVQAWAPLGRGRLSEDPILAILGEKYQKTASQIALRWIVQHGCIPLPGSKNKEHIRENIEINDFTLSNEEMDELNQRAKVGKRERVTLEMGIGFADEFDFSYEECWK